jgi:hypothetical protein
MMPKTTSAEMNMKEMSPMIKIMRSEIKADGDEGRNISNGISKRDQRWLYWVPKEGRA